MLHQAIISASLETLEDFCIGSFNLVVALWMRNRCIASLSSQIFTLSMECSASELGHVVSDDCVWDPKPVDDGLDKLHYRLLVDLDHSCCFGPHGKFINGNVDVLVPSDGPGEWPKDVQSPHDE
jgi:hypothetical protein